MIVSVPDHCLSFYFKSLKSKDYNLCSYSFRIRIVYW